MMMMTPPPSQRPSSSSSSSVSAAGRGGSSSSSSMRAPTTNLHKDIAKLSLSSSPSSSAKQQQQQQQKEAENEGGELSGLPPPYPTISSFSPHPRYGTDIILPTYLTYIHTYPTYIHTYTGYPHPPPRLLISIISPVKSYWPVFPFYDHGIWCLWFWLPRVP